MLQNFSVCAKKMKTLAITLPKEAGGAKCASLSLSAWSAKIKGHWIHDIGLTKQRLANKSVCFMICVSTGWIPIPDSC